jgi:hypothetical protein
VGVVGAVSCFVVAEVPISNYVFGIFIRWKWILGQTPPPSKQPHANEIPINAEIHVILALIAEVDHGDLG